MGCQRCGNVHLLHGSDTEDTEEEKCRGRIKEKKIFPCAIPPLKLLEEVRAAVGPDFKIFVDGGLNNGYDAFKAFALGADGVLSARALLGAFTNGGSIGVEKKILEMNAELKGAMCATCSPDLKHINRDCIIKM